MMYNAVTKSDIKSVIGNTVYKDEFYKLYDSDTGTVGIQLTATDTLNIEVDFGDYIIAEEVNLYESRYSADGIFLSAVTVSGVKQLYLSPAQDKLSCTLGYPISRLFLTVSGEVRSIYELEALQKTDIDTNPVVLTYNALGSSVAYSEITVSGGASYAYVDVAKPYFRHIELSTDGLNYFCTYKQNLLTNAYTNNLVYDEAYDALMLQDTTASGVYVSPIIGVDKKLGEHIYIDSTLDNAKLYMTASNDFNFLYQNGTWRLNHRELAVWDASGVFKVVDLDSGIDLWSVGSLADGWDGHILNMSDWYLLVTNGRVYTIKDGTVVVNTSIQTGIYDVVKTSDDLACLVVFDNGSLYRYNLTLYNVSTQNIIDLTPNGISTALDLSINEYGTFTWLLADDSTLLCLDVDGDITSRGVANKFLSILATGNDCWFMVEETNNYYNLYKINQKPELMFGHSILTTPSQLFRGQNGDVLFTTSKGLYRADIGVIDFISGEVSKEAAVSIDEGIILVVTHSLVEFFDAETFVLKYTYNNHRRSTVSYKTYLPDSIKYRYSQATEWLMPWEEVEGNILNIPNKKYLAFKLEVPSTAVGMLKGYYTNNALDISSEEKLVVKVDLSAQEDIVELFDIELVS